MSRYGIHKVLWLLQNDLDVRERLRTDPESVLADMPLTDAERQALLSRDMAALWRMGVHTFLMSRIPRFNAFGGFTRAEYQQSIDVVLTDAASSERSRA